MNFSESEQISWLISKADPQEDFQFIFSCEKDIEGSNKEASWSSYFSAAQSLS